MKANTCPGTLHVASRELDIKVEFAMPDVVNRPVTEDVCSDE